MCRTVCRTLSVTSLCLLAYWATTQSSKCSARQSGRHDNPELHALWQGAPTVDAHVVEFGTGTGSSILAALDVSPATFIATLASPHGVCTPVIVSRLKVWYCAAALSIASVPCFTNLPVVMVHVEW